MSLQTHINKFDIMQYLIHEYNGCLAIVM